MTVSESAVLDALLLELTLLHDDGQWDALEQTLATAPDHPHVGVFRVALLNKRGEHDRALLEANALLVRAPEIAGGLHRQAGYALRAAADYPNAIRRLDLAVKHSLDTRERALALRARGVTRVEFNDPGGLEDCREAVAISAMFATPHREAVARLDLGYALARTGQLAEAASTYRDALPGLRSKPNLHALALNNLADVCQELGRFEDALEYAERGVRLAKARAGRSRRSALHSTHGDALRALGALEEAITAFERALRVADTPHRQTMASVGLGQTWRALGRSARASDALHLTAYQSPPGVARGFALTALAATMLEDDPTGAGVRLHEASILLAGQAAGRVRVEFFQAELARRQGREDATRSHMLEALTVAERTGARGPIYEEAKFLEVLYAQAREWLEPQRAAMLPLGRVQPAREVNVTSLGRSGVTVGGREVHVVGDALALVVFLLLEGGGAGGELLKESFYPMIEAPHLLTRRIKTLTDAARRALGWSDSLRYVGGVYRLDPHATWNLDVLEPLQAIERGETVRVRGRFLPSSYFDWVVEVRDRLEDAGR
jgi:tetratricopeptide (TPR) repeat protein